jgi:hypothetical protein
VSKPGYVSQTVKVESNFSSTGGTAMVAGGLVTILSAGIDAASGAYKSLYPNPVSVHLVPSGKAGKRAATAQASGSTLTARTKTAQKSKSATAIPSLTPSRSTRSR